MATERSVESARIDDRWVATVALDTGASIVRSSEWKPSHWDEQQQNRARTILDAKAEARDAERRYGVQAVEIRVVHERRTVRRIEETTTAASFDSVHYLGEADRD